LSSTASGSLAVIVGVTGSIGSALLAELQSSGGFASIVGLSRQGSPRLDLTNESSIRAAALYVANQLEVDNLALKLVIDATGMLHSATHQPEKSWTQLDANQMAQAFAINAVGPALLMKHFLPLLPRQGRSVFATLSAKVGSIGDNRLGGWYRHRIAISDGIKPTLTPLFSL